MKRACVSRQGGGGAEGEVLARRLKARQKLVKKRPASTWSHSALPRARYLTSRSLGDGDRGLRVGLKLELEATTLITGIKEKTKVY
jgi:hypothetical protein